MNIQHIVPMFLEITAGTVLMTTVAVMMMSAIMNE